MSRPTAMFLLLLVPAWGCQRQPESTRLCLSEDLGRYRLEALAPLRDVHGCLATYRDPRGKLASVRVVRDRPDLFGDGGVAYPFEKHVVYYRAIPGGVEAGWHHGNIGVSMTLEDLAVPQGPVLRAYLFRYRSGVEADRQLVEEEVAALRDEGRRRPKDAAVHLELARKYRSLGNQVMATQEYHVAVDADRSCFECYLEMGTLYFELRHWDLAIRALRRAAAIEPQNARSRMWLGDVFFKVHNGQEALRAYQQAVELGLEGKDQERVARRIEELKKGKYMIEVLPGARKGQGPP